MSVENPRSSIDTASMLIDIVGRFAAAKNRLIDFRNNAGSNTGPKSLNVAQLPTQEEQLVAIGKIQRGTQAIDIFLPGFEAKIETVQTASRLAEDALYPSDSGEERRYWRYLLNSQEAREKFRQIAVHLPDSIKAKLPDLPAPYTGEVFYGNTSLDDSYIMTYRVLRQKGYGVELRDGAKCVDGEDLPDHRAVYCDSLETARKINAIQDDVQILLQIEKLEDRKLSVPESFISQAIDKIISVKPDLQPPAEKSV